MSENREGFIDQEEIDEVIELEDGPAPEDEDLQNNQEQVDDDDMEEEDVVDESIGQFVEHNEAVLCCDVSKDDQLVVTGGQDDKAVVWEAATQKMKFEISGHKDSVVAAKFNVNSTLVATGDLSGFIQVFDMSGQRQYDFEVDDLNWMLWHPVADNVLLAGTKAGDAWMWKLSQTSPQCKTFQSFGNENMCAKVFDDGKRIVMGYEDGSIRLWDMKDTQVTHSITDHQAHKGPVLCLDLNSDNSLIASGSIDSTVKIINANNFKLLLTISSGVSNSKDEEEDSDSIESVAFSGKNLLALGTVNGAIEIWDVSSQTKRSELNLGSQGVSKIATDRANSSLLYCGCLDSTFRVIDLRSCEVIASRSGHTDHILDFAISADSKYALTCSEDATCKIFSLA